MSAIKKIQSWLNEQKLDGFIVPKADRFQGEFIAPSEERLKWLTGFTGSAGTAIIHKDENALFTDSRYTIQVTQEVNSSDFKVYDTAEKTLGQWLQKTSNNKIAYDPWLMTLDQHKNIKKSGVELVPTQNVVDLFWEDRPDAPQGSLFKHDLEFAGATTAEKQRSILKKLDEEGAEAALLSSPESIMWLLNVRGSDIDYTPYAYCFCLVEKKTITLFIDPQKVPKNLLDDSIQILSEDHIGETLLAKSDLNILIDPFYIPVAITSFVKKPLLSADPCILLKSLKNKTEQKGIIKAHDRDGVALSKFLHWMTTIKDPICEYDAGKMLDNLRAKLENFHSLSFPTILGSGPNGAIVHYRANKSSSRNIQAGDIVLVDSGGQYFDGTTDVTRTFIHQGTATQHQKDCFTMVLKGHIAVDAYDLKKDSCGKDIDPVARQALKESGLDYGHSTGHGVGCFLSVHEGPQGISSKNTVPLQAGMVVSNEPGYYEENEFGIRIESLILVEEKNEKNAFKTLTMAPIDKKLINKSLLTEHEITWLNDYHKQVFEKISSHLDQNEKEWLKSATEPL